jgi:hypothetical protein
MKQYVMAVAGLFLGVCCLFAEEAKQSSPSSVALRTQDGSNLVGIPVKTAITMETTIGRVSVPLTLLKGIECEQTAGKTNVVLQFTNGDRLSGSWKGEAFAVRTSFGEQQVPLALIRSVTVCSVGGTTDKQDGLVLHYSFDSDTGCEVTDTIGTNNGMAAETKWTSLGKSGGAMEFDGRDSCITLFNSEEINRLRAMTFSAWVNLRAMPSDFAGIASRRSPSDLWWFGVKNGFGLQLYLSGAGNGGDRTTGAATIAPGSWCHTVFTYESGKASAIYINGKPINVVPVSGSLPGDARTPVRIGRGVGPSETFDGTIDEVMIFDRALTGEEVARLYEAGR